MQRIIEWLNTAEDVIPLNTDIIFVRKGEHAIETGYTTEDGIIPADNESAWASIPLTDIAWFAYLSDAMPRKVAYGKDAVIEKLLELGYQKVPETDADEEYEKEIALDELMSVAIDNEENTLLITRFIDKCLRGSAGVDMTDLWKGPIDEIEVSDSAITCRQKTVEIR